jgi:hypothetical protein
MDFNCTFEFAKAETDGSYVRGWASVVAVNGAPVTDTQGDIISMDELRKAAHKFISDARVAKAMHAGQQVGDVVESVIIDDEFAKAMGISDGKRGWWIGMKINSPEIRKGVRENKFRAFSIGGRGRRTKVEQ